MDSGQHQTHKSTKGGEASQFSQIICVRAQFNVDIKRGVFVVKPHWLFQCWEKEQYRRNCWYTEIYWLLCIVYILFFQAIRMVNSILWPSFLALPAHFNFSYISDSLSWIFILYISFSNPCFTHWSFSPTLGAHHIAFQYTYYLCVWQINLWILDPWIIVHRLLYNLGWTLLIPGEKLCWILPDTSWNVQNKHIFMSPWRVFLDHNQCLEAMQRYHIIYVTCCLSKTMNVSEIILINGVNVLFKLPSSGRSHQQTAIQFTANQCHFWHL